METFLVEFFVFLVSAVIAVPVAKSLGLSSVLGYLLAGIVIGPYGMSFIGDTENIMHFTEFGVVMMLFLVGLELKPSLLWKMRVPIVGMGGLQVMMTTIVISALSSLYLPWQSACAIGLILALSSTAIILQTLQEKAKMDTDIGRSIFSVLLFQDLAVIPIFAILPLLATLPIVASSHANSMFFDIQSLPVFVRLCVTISAIFAVLFFIKFTSRPIFRAIAMTGVREIFVAAALALVIGTSLLMMAVGLSPALGAFLAGVVLSDSEFRHEIESDIEPFKGLLLSIFFISIGASLDFSYIYHHYVMIFVITVALILSKYLVLRSVAWWFDIAKHDRHYFGIALAQGGEFAFVLFQFSKHHGVLGQDVISPVLSAVAISMFVAPLLFLLYEKMSVLQSSSHQSISHDTVSRSGHKVILVGFGRLGTDVGRFLLSYGLKPVILDHDYSNVNVLRKLGFEVYYGDATRLDLLESAGAAQAHMLVVTIGELEQTKQLVSLAKKHYPHLKVVVNAADRRSSFELMGLGVQDIHRETSGTSLDIGRSVLEQLGVDPYEAYRLSLIFKKKDKEMMPHLYASREQEKDYISLYQKHHEHLEKLMNYSENFNWDDLDKAWTAKNPEV